MDCGVKTLLGVLPLLSISFSLVYGIKEFKKLSHKQLELLSLFLQDNLVYLLMFKLFCREISPSGNHHVISHCTTIHFLYSYDDIWHVWPYFMLLCVHVLFFFKKL